MKLSPKQQQRLQHAFTLHEAGLLEAAAEAYRGLLRAMPAATVVLSNFGMVLLQLGRREEGLSLLERSLRIEPRQAAVSAACAMASIELGKAATACDFANKALVIEPTNFAAHHALGMALHMLGRYREAIDAYQRTLELVPDHVEALCNLGLSQVELGERDSATLNFEHAIRLDPLFLAAHINLLHVFIQKGQYEDGVKASQKLLTLMPSSHEAHYEYACFLELSFMREEACAAYQKVVELNPSSVDGWLGVARVSRDLKRYQQALGAYRTVLSLDQNVPFIRSDLLGLSLELCLWDDYAVLLAGLNPVSLSKGSALRPFESLRLPVSPACQLAAARHWATTELEGAPSPQVALPKGVTHKTRRLRVGIVTSDLKDHPVAFLLEQLLPVIDRKNLCLVGLPTAVANVSELRRALFDEWDELVGLTGQESIDRLRILKLDLILNLNGITLGERSELFATRVAPVQVSFLGYAGTLGGTFVDYLVADEYAIPADKIEFYSEQIAYLPNTFFVPNTAKISDVAVSRADEGLPATGIVFCCFNNSYKITPDVFDIWMYLLKQVPGSVLWLSGANVTVVDNLRKEAELREISSERLIFAKFRESRADHLRRLQLADIFLDTFYYNAHTTASDALWAGVPVVTCPGETFASRVAGSLLKAAGMDDLITDSREDYEAKALQLAKDPALLAETRARLARNKETYPIFDMPRYASNFERLLQAMWARYEQGLAPAPIRLDD